MGLLNLCKIIKWSDLDVEIILWDLFSFPFSSLEIGSIFNVFLVKNIQNLQ